MHSDNAAQVGKERRPAAFFASRMHLSIRGNIHKLGEKIRREIWVSGQSAPEFVGRLDEETQIICLKKVREAEKFICVLDGSYGTPWSQTQLSILELELATAVLANKPLYIFLLKPLDEDPRLTSLLSIIRLAYPAARYAIYGSEQKICDTIERMLDDRKRSFWSRSPGYFVQYQARFRTALFKKSDFDVRFLNADFYPADVRAFDKEFISHLIQRTDEEDIVPYKLANLWAAFRHLGNVPYTSQRFKEFLPLWGAVISRWASAASWYGLHGHSYLGRLAATNTLLDLKDINQKFTKAANPISVSTGDLASEYISIARLAVSPHYKWALYKRAEEHIKKALAESTKDTSGLLSMLGSLYFSTGRWFKSVKDFKKALRVREEANEDDGRIGEAEADLGLAYFFVGGWSQAQKHLEEGVAKLKCSDRVGFTIRAMKKLMLFYGLTFQRELARATYEEVYKYAQVHEMNDQLRQIDSIARRLLLKKLSRT